MGKVFLLSLALLVLLRGSLAVELKHLPIEIKEDWQRNECQLDQLNALEPSFTEEHEAGRVEEWNYDAQQLRCAGVHFFRTTVQPKGLFLPTFFSSPKISYVVQGQGTMGRVLPGCAETFMDMETGPQPRRERGHAGESFRDMHQRVDDMNEGDVIATPSGTAFWLYNYGDRPLVIVSVLDTSSPHNQLDQRPRSFHLAGNGQQGQQKGRRGYSGESAQKRNLFSGLAVRILSQVYKIDAKTAEKLKNFKDNRGNIVKVEGRFQVVSPPSRWSRESERREEEEGYSPRRKWSADNGLEETFCSMRFHENLDDPSRADIYKPQLGRISTLNSNDLPILRYLRLSALRGVIYGDALELPRWNMNANEVLYVTGGAARIQVVNDNGQNVFDEVLRKGQLIVVPQGFAVVKRTEGESRFEWIAFKTNDNAMANSLAGRTSYMRALPIAVISNAYQVSEEDAMKLKFNTMETTLTRASSGYKEGQGRRAEA